MKNKIPCNTLTGRLQEVLQKERVEVGKDLEFVEDYAYLCKKHGKMIDNNGDLVKLGKGKDADDLIVDMVTFVLEECRRM